MTLEEELLDYRRTVAGIYSRVREGQEAPEKSWLRFRQERDALFRTHPQSALFPDVRERFTALDYFPYDPTLRFVVPVEPLEEPTIMEMRLESDGLVRFQRFGRVHFTVEGQPVSLVVYWVLGYGGGVFLPFGDKTNGKETYGAGRYLLDTIKHADLGQTENGLILDFNFAYNPSCAYDARWFCPLAPAENRLSVAIRAGEKSFPDALA